jgi:hypothetical protein
MSNRMLRYPSYSSSNSASSPRRTLSFFNKIRHGSRDDQEDKVYEVGGDLSPLSSSQANHTPQPRESDKIVNSLFYLPISETTTRGSNGSMPSPDPFVFSSHDKEYRILVEYTRRIRKVAQDQKKMDSAWEQYKKIRDECYQLCKSLLNKSRKYTGFLYGECCSNSTTQMVAVKRLSNGKLVPLIHGYHIAARPARALPFPRKLTRLGSQPSTLIRLHNK